ncbi:MAG: putative toxin-antitoxin system toxin component, PIN family [Candidatus Omnitrophota bacterium]
MLKVVLDTNVFVSILVGGRLKENLYPLLLKSKFQIFLTWELLNELLYILSKPEFKLTEPDLENFKTFLKRKAIFVESKEKISVCRDVEDNKILECAVSGKVDSIVTGDRDLLSLSSFRKISIVTPAEFAKILQLI